MNALFNFIVEPKTGRTTAVKKIEDSELILNTELQNHHYVSRLGIVKSGGRWTPTRNSPRGVTQLPGMKFLFLAMNLY